MTAKYLIRMDDACHTMDRCKWQHIELILDECKVKPIVAVVPENRDPQFMIDSHDTMFWDKARDWQAKGWTIAMHGYTHLMHHTESELLLPYYKHSEFAGLSYEEQAEKIRQSWRIFQEQGIEPKAWIAPAHCFDALTLQAIRNETSIQVVSDGIAWDVYYKHDFYWIPQQIWGLVERKSGLWTVSLHPNMMTEASIAALGNAIRSRFCERIISFQDVQLKRQGKSLLGRLYHSRFWWRRKEYGFALREIF
jgi:hypothetical protein